MVTPLNRRLRIAATVIVSIAGLIGLAFLATYYYLKPTLPDVAVLRDVRLQVPLRVFSRDGKLLAQIGEQRRVPVTWEQIPPVVVQAVLAAEDDRFFQHPGVDWQGIARAVMVAATTMEASQGGSTLTQQLVRTTLITKEKQLRRKLREVFLALSLENELSKEEIFTLFVNTQFLGQRSYGFAAAAETYYGKSLAEVDAAEAALLAGILQAPSRLNPVANVEQATERRTYVLRRMRELGYLDEAAWQAAMDKPVARGLHGPRVQVDAPYVGEMVRLVLFEKFGERIYSDGFQVVTTVDSRLQRAADVALRSAVLEYDRRHGWRGPAGHVDVEKVSDEALAGLIEERPVIGGLIPAIVVRTAAEEATVVARSGMRYRLGMDGIRWARVGDVTPKSPRDVLKIGDVVYVLPTGEEQALLAQVPEVQGAFVALDPHDGSVVALSGGFDYDASKFNRVVQARRQPGSSFKPFIYSAALEAGFTPASVDARRAGRLRGAGSRGRHRPGHGTGRRRNRAAGGLAPGQRLRPLLRPDAAARRARPLAQPRDDPRHAPDRRRLCARVRAALRTAGRAHPGGPDRGARHGAADAARDGGRLRGVRERRLAREAARHRPHPRRRRHGARGDRRAGGLRRLLRIA